MSESDQFYWVLLSRWKWKHQQPWRNSEEAKIFYCKWWWRLETIVWITCVVTILAEPCCPFSIDHCKIMKHIYYVWKHVFSFLSLRTWLISPRFLNYFPGRNSQGGVVVHVLWLVLAPLPILSCHTSQYRINIFQRTVKKVRNRKISGYVLKKTHSRAATVWFLCCGWHLERHTSTIWLAGKDFRMLFVSAGERKKMKNKNQRTNITKLPVRTFPRNPSAPS